MPSKNGALATNQNLLPITGRFFVFFSVLVCSSCYTPPKTPIPQPAEFHLDAAPLDVWNALIEYHTMEVGWEIGSMIRDLWTFRSRWSIGRFPEGSSEALDCGRYTAAFTPRSVPITEHSYWSLQGAIVFKLIVADDGGTVLRITPQFYAVLTKDLTGADIGDTRECRSKGTIERSILAGVQEILSESSPVTPTPSEPEIWEQEVSLAGCSEDQAKPLPEFLDEVLGAVVVLRGASSVGTGVLISPEGYVLTATHVLEGVSEVPVKFDSGLELPGIVDRASQFSDIALVKLAGSGYPCVPVSAGNTERGADLFAVGHPLGEGLSFSVSRGIVSGFREMDGVRFIQTDASLNPGNSGGPLLDMNGHLVAIVVWKAVGADLEGLGFGVPIQDALSAVGSRIR